MTTYDDEYDPRDDSSMDGKLEYLAAVELDRRDRLEAAGIDPDVDPAWCYTCHHDTAYCTCPDEHKE